MSRSVTESISIDEISDIQTEVSDTYGVDPEDINIEVVYQTTGRITIDVSDDSISDEELAIAFEEEMSALLGLHEGNVEVTIEEGIASYVIHSDTAETAQDIHDALVEPEFVTAIEDLLPIEIDSFDSDDAIKADVVVTVMVIVDTSDAENNLNRAAETLEDNFQNQGYDAHAESIF